MKSPTTGFLAAAFSVIGAAAGNAWTLTPCAQVGPEAEFRAKYAEEVRQAKPDTPLYTPHPYPETDAELFEDFLTYHTAAHADTPFTGMKPEDRTFFKAVAEERVQYDVIKVENWTPTRCRGGKIRSPYSVLRIYDTESGGELTRVVLDDVGHVVMLQHEQEDWKIDPVMSLEAAGEALATTIGTNVSDLQYVATWGMVSCSELHPCVAAREGDSAILLYTLSGDIYRVDSSSPRLSLARDLPPNRRGAATRLAKQQGRHLVSLGTDAFAAAELVVKKARH